LSFSEEGRLDIHDRIERFREIGQLMGCTSLECAQNHFHFLSKGTVCMGDEGEKLGLELFDLMASDNVLSLLAEYFLPLRSPDGELEIRLFF
jgi:hypothetical protein